jgi:hypothetical protein
LVSFFFPSLLGGVNGYVATVCALVQRVASTATRKVKDSVTGSVSSQVITTYSTSSVQIMTVLGSDSGTMAPPSLPADSSTAWYVPLADVTLGGVGVPWVAGTTIAQSKIAQTWEGGWIRRGRIQLATPAKIMTGAFSAGVNGRASTPLSNRWGATIACSAVLQHATNGAATWLILDDTHDWSRRVLTVKMCSIIGSGIAPVPPDQTTAPLPISSPERFFLSPTFAGDPTLIRNTVAGWTVGGSTNINLAHYQGRLEIEFNGAPFRGPTDYYVVIVEGSDQYIF